jgi:hypothetical protein
MLVVTSRWSIGVSNAAKSRACRAFAQGALQGMFASTVALGLELCPTRSGRKTFAARRLP